ncbi:MAG: hypothetical protein V4609_13315 [Pseudomonadota bacterium]
MALPPISVSASSGADGTLSSSGSRYGFDSSGWSVNLGGSGTALQSAGALPVWLVPALIVGAAWLVLRTKR